MSNKLVSMAKELLIIESDFKFHLDYSTGERPVVDDFDIYTFDQVWGSTALGFPGIGGQAITVARTYVFVPVYCKQKCVVYFGARFAYTADYSEAFKEDLKNHNMAPVNKAGKYNDP